MSKMKREILVSVLVLALFLAGCTSVVEEGSMEETPSESMVEETPQEPVTEQVEETETAEATHTIKFVGEKFEPEELKVKVGDTVVWQNDRDSPQLNKAMVVGTKGCTFLKSKLLGSGEKYEYTFTEPVECEIVDGYVTSVFGKVVVE